MMSNEQREEEKREEVSVSVRQIAVGGGERQLCRMIVP